jgi:hypothetical protein
MTLPYQGSDDVLAHADERDRRPQGTRAIRSALREPVDRKCVPIRGQAPRALSERVFTCLGAIQLTGLTLESDGSPSGRSLPRI